METINEAHSGPTTPAMAGPAAEVMMFTVKPTNKNAKEMPLSQPGRSVSMRVSVTKKTSLRIRNWVKRSNSSGEVSSRNADIDPSVTWPKIMHLGGGRVEDAPSTGTGAAQRSRTPSADSRRTQWLDFYSQDPEPPGLSTKPPTRHPPLSRPRPPNREIDLRPLPLRVPSLERKDEPPKSLTRKDSKWKALPGLPTQNQRAYVHASTESADVEKFMGKIVLDSPPLPAEDDKKPDQVSLHVAVSQQKEADAGSILPNTVYAAMPGLGTPPPTPDSASGSTAMAVTITRSTASSTGKHFPSRKDSSAHARPPPHSHTLSESCVLTPVSPIGSTTGRYSRQERMWLHRNYRGEAPFLSAWGLDITSQHDREEGVGILKELMMEELRKGQGLFHT
ncbi:hypothetical protein QBC40DRAFT_286761 [Triangularia verruculosa]|uniref:Uncharacterized protein n=1 Tax=Triangularia verruculosa TaxID=2587418 RepID=A0AAN7ART9_9PEZI|nr:hypothetical protein QBC40DRAFT_286761 [Triangularia verruculosa]